MPAKIRLQRHGKKGYAFFHIVIADGRAPRNGKFIEKIGTYNPNTNPATIELNNEKALEWLKNGAQPTETTRAILSYKGVMMKLHLEKGVAKGALTAEQAEEKFNKWESEKSGKIEGKRTNLAAGKSDYEKNRMAAEVARNKQRAEAIVVKNTPPAAATEAPAGDADDAEATSADATPVVAAVVEKTPVAEPIAAVEEVPVVEATPEAPAASVVEETPAAEPIAAVEEVPVVEATPEAPAASVVEETPVAEPIAAVEEVPVAEPIAAVEEAPVAEATPEAPAAEEEKA